MLKLSEFARPELIRVGLSVATKEEALRALAATLAQDGAIAVPEPLFGLLMQRENLGSSGIGQGFAVPHTKSELVERMWMAVAVADPPIDWDALDEQPVDVIFLVASRADRPGDHLRLLERITRARHMVADFVPALRRARSPQEACDAILAADALLDAAS